MSHLQIEPESNKQDVLLVLLGPLVSGSYFFFNITVTNLYVPQGRLLGVSIKVWPDGQSSRAPLGPHWFGFGD